jgi:hypothetical protein
MTTIAEVRQQYPQYSDMSDMQLARALHTKHYSDMEFGTFARKIGMLDEPKVGPTDDYKAVREGGDGPMLTQPVEYRTALEGAGKFFTDMALGARQAVGTMGRGGIVSDMIRGTGDPALEQEAQTKREIDQPLMETGAGRVGHTAATVLSAVPALAIPGANTAAGSAVVGAAFGATQPATSPRERAVNTGVAAAAGGASQFIGQKVSNFIGSRIAQRTASAEASQAQNSVRDTTLREARRAGYVVPPATTNPTVANRVAESLSGKAATQQAAAVRNQSVTNRLVREDLGLSETAPLTRETLNGIRTRAGNVYRAIKNVGEIVTDADYLDDLTRLTQSVDEVANDFPDANVAAGKEINELVDTLLRDKFRASSAVEYTKQLRAAASANLAHGVDPTRRALGFAQRDAAGALEEMVFRHLQNTGKGSLATQFEQARILIAKTYSVEGALNDSTGNVVATALGRELKRGKPLTGGIEMAARFAQAFPKAAREITDSPGVSAVDALVAGAGAATVNPGMLALPVGRMGARAGVLSETYQNAATTPNYSPRTRMLEAGRYAADRVALPAIVTATYPEEK